MLYKGEDSIPKHWAKIVSIPYGVSDDGEEAYYWDKDEKRVVRILDAVREYETPVEMKTAEIHEEEWYRLDQLVLEVDSFKVVQELKKRRYITADDVAKARLLAVKKLEKVKPKSFVAKMFGY